MLKFKKRMRSELRFVLHKLKMLVSKSLCPCGTNNVKTAQLLLRIDVVVGIILTLVYRFRCAVNKITTLIKCDKKIKNFYS